jgi:hypothetical protein
MKFSYLFKNGLHILRTEIAGTVHEFVSRLSLHDVVQMAAIEKANAGEFLA